MDKEELRKQIAELTIKLRVRFDLEDKINANDIIGTLESISLWINLQKRDK